MNAKYYRYLFHRVTDGLCYSGSIRSQMTGEEESFCFLYLAGGEEAGEDGASYAAPGLTYDLLILGDFSKGAKERAKRVLENCQVEKVLYPAGEASENDAVIRELKRNCRGSVASVLAKEEFHACREKFCVMAVSRGAERTLALYHADAKGTPWEEECILCVKPALPEYACQVKDETGKFACEMRCALYNDFDVCKRQNQKNQKEFVDGHLLLGAGGPDSQEVCPMPDGLTDSDWERIRVIGFSDSSLNLSDIHKIEKPGELPFRRYLVGTRRAEATVAGELAADHPYWSYFRSGEKTGLCVSGYYVPRKG